MKKLVLNKQNIRCAAIAQSAKETRQKKLWGQDENGIKFEKEEEG